MTFFSLRNLELMIWESDKNRRLEHKNHCGWCRCRHMPWPAWHLRAYPLQPGFGSGKGLQLKTQKVLRFQHAHITSRFLPAGLQHQVWHVLQLCFLTVWERLHVATHVALICWLPNRQRTNWFDTISCFLPGILHLCIFVILMFATIGACIYCFTHS